MKLSLGSILKHTAELFKYSYSFSSIQCEFPKDIAEKVFNWSLSNIPEEDLINKGREDDIHITLKYGLHNHDPFELRKIICNSKPVKVTLGNISIFENDGEDVVKIDVSSSDLHNLNKKISDNFEHTDSHKNYIPHTTLAYVKSGCGKKYEGREDFKGLEVTFDSVVFSGNDNRKTVLRFEG